MSRMPLILTRLLMAGAASLTLLMASSSLAQELGESKPPRDRSQEGNRDKDPDQSPDSPTRSELRKRFEARLERVDRLKGQRLIGETFDGWVQAVDERALNAEQRELLTAENDDRKALYALIADRVDEQRRRVPPRVVAERNARRNFEKAEPDQLLKVAEGYWIAKRDLPRAEELTRAKKAGDLGETWEGLLGAVGTRPTRDTQALVESENAARREIYRQVAKKIDGGSPADVGQLVGRSTRDLLPRGFFYQLKSGHWEKRPDK